MPINYPSEGGKENSQRESDEALGWETGLLAHTHTQAGISHWHTHAKIRKYGLVRADPRATTRDHHSPSKKAYKHVKMSRFDGVIDGGRARETQG